MVYGLCLADDELESPYSIWIVVMSDPLLMARYLRYRLVFVTMLKLVHLRVYENMVYTNLRLCFTGAGV